MTGPPPRAVVGAVIVGLVFAVTGCTSGGTEDSPDSVGLPFAESFESGTAGEAVTEDNSIFTVVLNDPATFQATLDPVQGALVGHYASSGQNIRTKVEFAAPSGVARVYERLYLWIDEYPSAVMRFLTLETSPSVTPPGEDVLALRMDQAGRLTLYDGSTFDDANRSVEPLPRDEWIRLEVEYDAETGVHGRSVLRVFSGEELRSADPTYSLSVDHVASPSNPVTTAAFGVLNRVSVDYSIDAIEASADGWVGPGEG